jgi:alkaline phosphatase D
MRRFAILAALLPVLAFAGGGAKPGDGLERAALDLSKPLTRVAFGSCAHQGKEQPFWNAILETQPDVFLFMGDNVYGDTLDMKALRGRYRQLAEKEAFRNFWRKTPILATWDDHDYGWNDAGGEYPQKRASREVFFDFFGVAADSPRRAHEGVYDAVIAGPEGKRVQILLLDTRYNRGPMALRRLLPDEKGGRYKPHPIDKHVPFLGEKQWKWLEEQLKKPAELRILASSVQFGPDEHGSECWGNFPSERRRFLDLVRKTRASGIVIASGDRHHATLSKWAPPEAQAAGAGGAFPPYPFYELTSSGLTQTHNKPEKDEPNRLRLAPDLYRNNFGTVVVDWEKKTVTLELRDMENRRVLSQPVSFAEIALPTAAAAAKPKK